MSILFENSFLNIGAPLRLYKREDSLTKILALSQHRATDFVNRIQELLALILPDDSRIGVRHLLELLDISSKLNQRESNVLIVECRETFSVSECINHKLTWPDHLGESHHSKTSIDGDVPNIVYFNVDRQGSLECLSCAVSRYPIPLLLFVFLNLSLRARNPDRRKNGCNRADSLHPSCCRHATGHHSICQRKYKLMHISLHGRDKRAQNQHREHPSNKCCVYPYPSQDSERKFHYFFKFASTHTNYPNKEMQLPSIKQACFVRILATMRSFFSVWLPIRYSDWGYHLYGGLFNHVEQHFALTQAPISSLRSDQLLLSNYRKIARLICIQSSNYSLASCAKNARLGDQVTQHQALSIIQVLNLRFQLPYKNCSINAINNSRPIRIHGGRQANQKCRYRLPVNHHTLKNCSDQGATNISSPLFVLLLFRTLFLPFSKSCCSFLFPLDSSRSRRAPFNPNCHRQSEQRAKRLNPSRPVT